MTKKKTELYWECCKVNKYGEPKCGKYDTRCDIIHKIIDGQATKEEKQLYDELITNCTDCKCKEYCEQELAIRDLIKTKLDRKRVPIDVIESIKIKIEKSS